MARNNATRRKQVALAAPCLDDRGLARARWSPDKELDKALVLSANGEDGLESLTIIVGNHNLIQHRRHLVPPSTVFLAHHVPWPQPAQTPVVRRIRRYPFRHLQNRHNRGKGWRPGARNTRFPRHTCHTGRIWCTDSTFSAAYRSTSTSLIQYSRVLPAKGWFRSILTLSSVVSTTNAGCLFPSSGLR